MSQVHDQPVSYEVAPDAVPVRHRSAFSRSTFGLINHHALSAGADGRKVGRSRRRKVPDESLHLIDDLTNRPLDPLFEDSTLLPQKQSVTARWVTRVLTFLFCVVVGFSGCLAVQELHRNTRQKVRVELAAQVSAVNQKRQDLESEVADQRGKIQTLTEQLQSSQGSATVLNDAVTNGTVAVRGRGVTVSLSDPIAVNDGEGAILKDKDGKTIRVVADTDLQVIVSRLWAAGAEAIAVNNVRLGVQSSIRVAGQTILVGVTPVQSPYKIQAIGDPLELSQALSKTENAAFYDSLSQVGIYPDVAQTRDITLEAASAPELNHAKGVN